MWCTTKPATDAGGWRPINRAGQPMMWPIFWPDDTDFANPANTRHPSEDISGFAGMNGRTLADDAPEAMLSLVTNMAVPSGLKPSVARDQRDSTFPYVVPAGSLR